MGMYKHIRDLKKNQPEEVSNLKRERLLKWRREEATKRIERPTNLARARSLGYKAKPGILVVRQRVKRGGRMREQLKAGRRSKAQRRRKVLDKNYQQIAEEKANRKFTNCEIVNSYKVLEDGHHSWYEVIMVDRFHPQVLADPELKQRSQRKRKAYRGLTSAGKKSRGLRKKGKGSEKTRPSKKAYVRKKS